MNIFIPLAALCALLLMAKPAEAARRTHAQVLKDARPADVDLAAHRWSSVFDVPVAWIRSQAYAESQNIPTATNPRTDARGVLQILPTTAAWLVTSLLKSKWKNHKRVIRTLKTKWRGNSDDLYDVELNVMLATYYMNILTKQFGKIHEFVAAAYNAGPGKVARLLSAGQPLPKESLTYLAMVADAKSRGFM